MTEGLMSLRALVEKTPDADILREMIGFAAERLMEPDVGAPAGAAHGEKNPLRLAEGDGSDIQPSPPQAAFELDIRSKRD